MRSLPSLITLFALVPSISGAQGLSNAAASAKLVGTWEMVEEQETDAQGRVVARDRDVVGMLVYTAEGRMAVQIMYRHGRPPVSTANDVESTGLGLGHVAWSAEALRATIDTYDAYFGTYVVDAQRNLVTHRVMGELRPPGLEAQYERHFQLQDDELWLSSPEPTQHWRSVWRRVRP